MFIFVFTLEIGFAGIYVSFTFFVKVVLSFIFSHCITSLVDCRFMFVFLVACSKDTAFNPKVNVSRMAEK